MQDVLIEYETFLVIVFWLRSMHYFHKQDMHCLWRSMICATNYTCCFGAWEHSCHFRWMDTRYKEDRINSCTTLSIPWLSSIVYCVLSLLCLQFISYLIFIWPCMSNPQSTFQVVRSMSNDGLCALFERPCQLLCYLPLPFVYFICEDQWYT